MGIFHSKVAPAEKKTRNQSSDDSLDPRSPTVNINRSPISPVGLEIALEKPTITKVRDLTADLTEILDHAQTPERTGAAATSVIGEKKLQSVLDPRSPPLSFARTPMVLDDSNVSTATIISLQATSLEYEEISYVDEEEEEKVEEEEELVVPQGELTLSFKDCDEAVSVIVGSDGASLFSDTSLNTELKADIDGIIQKLFIEKYEAGSDPRSPSIDIQRTPIVFEEVYHVKQEEELKESECENKTDEDVSLPKEEEQTENSQESKTNTTVAIIHQDQDENQQQNATPKREKADKTPTAARTPLGCVTNTPSKLSGPDMRKTALFGQMKQNAATTAVVINSAETIPGKKLKPRSKIPTLRMK